MKKIGLSIIIILFILIYFINPVFAEIKDNSSAETEIGRDVSMGNSNGNIANGGYIVGSQNGENTYYAYINIDWKQSYYSKELSSEPVIIKDPYMEDVTELTTGLNCRCLNNYKDEWIYYLKDNDGKIYRSKTDGSRTEKLDTDFDSDIIYIIGDYIIAATDGYDKGNIVAIDLNGKLINVIVNDDPRLENLMLNIDENYVYYYNEIDNKIYRATYDGEKSEEIYSGAVDSFQISDNKLYVKGRESRGKKDILYIYDLNEVISQTDTYDTKSDYTRIGYIEYINEFNASDLGVFFVRAPYGNALLYHCNADGSDIEWVDVRTAFDWNIYVVNGKVYQYDIVGGALDKAAEVGNIHYMNNKTYAAPPGSYTIND